ncbi:gas vesicle protein GvpR [Sinobaca sp. H24]|uniref:gas vesicle protein GvpR n=1 Tax=Sinobaca sp. H24 TaxID=2923376 RepID=UPI002079BCB6|nr:gas vesicle protein GvpR [Sinobaca sp. H24]
MEELLQKVTTFFENYVLPPFKITSVINHDEGWDVEVEVIEESEYMKKYAKDQLLGVYEANLIRIKKLYHFSA